MTAQTERLANATSLEPKPAPLRGSRPPSDRLPQTDEREVVIRRGAAKALAKAAATKSAIAAGTLALPPGPLGWLTILPELIAVWKIQAQMVADIAAVYGKKSGLNREQNVLLPVPHMAAQAVRDLIVQVGERFLVRRASLRVLQSVARKTGARITQRAIGKGFSRWLLSWGQPGLPPMLITIPAGLPRRPLTCSSTRSTSKQRENEIYQC